MLDMINQIPQLSIIVPVYNTEAWLPRCLDALVEQTFTDIEILCIDDGSTDTSLSILQTYAAGHSRIRVFSQPNAGPATARNRGLDHARGRYVMFCDSDDWYDTRCCERMHDTIVKWDVDVVVCQTQFGYAAGQQRAIKESYFNSWRSGRYCVDDEIAITCNTVLWNKIWKLDLIKRVGIRFPDGHEHDDDALWFMYALEAKTIYFLSEQLVHYWIRTGSIMDHYAKQCPAKKHDRILIARQVHAFAKRQGFAIQHRRRIVAYYRTECKGLMMGLFTVDEITQLIDELNAAYFEGDELFFFFERKIKCVIRSDIQPTTWLRYVIACLASWVSVGWRRAPKKRERKYLRDVLRAKRHLAMRNVV